MQILISLGLAFAGGWLGMKTKIPAGTMLGAMAAVIAWQSWTDSRTVLPHGFGFICQVLVGLLIAAAYSPELLRSLTRLWVPVLFSCFSVIAMGMLVAVILYKMGYMDFPTSYIATSPGAMNVLVAISGDLKADVALVASFHFVRVFIVSLTAPLVFKLFRMLAAAP